MRTFFAVCTLLLPSALLWFRWRVQYDGKLSDTIETRICLTILVAYVVVILLLGSRAIEGIDSDFWRHRSLRRFMSSYLLPGIGFAVVLFPEMAARIADHYLYLARMDALKGYSIMGWMILTFSAVLLLGYHS